jgi:cell division protein FtsL
MNVRNYIYVLVFLLRNKELKVPLRILVLFVGMQLSALSDVPAHHKARHLLNTGNRRNHDKNVMKRCYEIYNYNVIDVM